MTRTATHPCRRMLYWTLAVACVLALTAPARAVEQGPYSMEVLVDGRPLTEYFARGRTYIEALEGKEYSVRLRNHTGARVAIALAVDGLNSIDAQTGAAGEGSKWILAPYQEIVIDGWQTSSSNARRFYFTSETASYGAWLGETENLGVIAAAVFRERVPIARRWSLESLRRESAAEPQGAPAPPPPAAKPAPEAKVRERQDAAAGNADAESRLSDDLAATGIGREVDHPVERVHFDAERAPAATMTVRYEYRPALVKLGVLAPPCDLRSDRLSRREDARGFTDTGFAPDPYRRRDCR